MVTQGLDTLTITATDTDGGESQVTKPITVLPARPNADSWNYAGNEDSNQAITISDLISDINDGAGTYRYGTGTPDPSGSLTPFGASQTITGGGRVIGFQLEHGTLLLDDLTKDALTNDNATFTYTPDSDWVGTETFVYQYTAGPPAGTSSNIAEITIAVKGVNDVPVVSLDQSTVSVDEENDLFFNAGNGNRIHLADIDAGSSAVELLLEVNSGTLALASTTGITFLEGANNAGRMKIRGSLSDLQVVVDGLSYTGVTDFYGTDNLSVILNDAGNTGSVVLVPATSYDKLTQFPPHLRMN